MCRLLTVISKKNEKAGPWFFDSTVPFCDFSKRIINLGPHNSGWGIGWLNKKNSWEIFKEGKENVRKYNFNKIKKVQSKIIVAHLRWASVGSESSNNAQPFKYKNFIFMHNGTLKKESLIKYLNEKFKKKIKTETDSEIYFLLIMQALEEFGSFLKAIKETLKIVKKYSYTGLNFIISDGKTTYAYRDFDRSNKEFYKYYTLKYLIKEKQIVIASDALNNEKWVPLGIGEIIVINSNLNIKKFKL